VALNVPPVVPVELFIRGDRNARKRVLTLDGDLRTETLHDGNVYHSSTIFQLKAMLYHVGILNERGTEAHRLDPTEDEWSLRDSV